MSTFLKQVVKMAVAGIGIGTSVLVLHRDCERAWQWINDTSSDDEDDDKFINTCDAEES